MRPFLTAEWRNLVLLNWRVPGEALAPFCPRGVELDAYNGEHWISIVAFEFRNTRVRGIAVPFHVNFPEINLRFYVRCGDQRGVVFIREFVPRRAISWVANVLYNEPYRYAPFQCCHRALPGVEEFDYTLGVGAARGSVRVRVSNGESIPQVDSLQHFLKEHDCGFGHDKSGRLLTYRVSHPIWSVREIKEFEITIPLTAYYGEMGALLGQRQPDNVIFAVGSAVEVYPAQRKSA